MSTAKFATACCNPTCAQPLAGPVAFCPYCATPITSAEPVKPAPTTKPTAAPAPPRPQATHVPPTSVEPSKSQPEATPAAAAPQPTKATSAEPVAALESVPRKKRGKLPLIVAGLVVVASALAWLNRTPPGPDLRAARQCLANNDPACAQLLAMSALQTHPDDPAAQQLLRQSQSALQQQQALAAERKAHEARLAAELERQHLAAERERLAAAKEQQRLEVERQALAAARAQERLEAERQASLEAEKPAREKNSRPPTSAPMRANNAAQQLLERARAALQRRDYQSAISLGQTAQSLEPGNRLAQDLIREAERQKRLVLQSTTIE